MYEKLVFSDIETVYDYFDYMKTKDDRKAYSAKYPVKLWDDYDKKYNRYYFSYGCVGDLLVSVDGQSTLRGSRCAFAKIEVEKKKPNQLLIGHFDLYEFEDLEDVQNFLQFANAYNNFIDKMLAKAIEECYSISNRLYASALSTATRNFVNMLPQQIFVEIPVYKAYLRDISWKHSVFSEYANFSMPDIRKAYDLIHNKANEKTFQHLSKMFNDFSNVIFGRYTLQFELQTLTTYFLIRRYLIEHYSEIWINSYCSDITHYGMDEYISDCVRKSIVSSSDNTAMTSLTYYLMSISSNPKEDYYMVAQNVYATVVKYENQKQQDIFVQQLFQNSNDARNRNKIDILDVDFMNGAEFENLICRLFQKMGFIAQVTKHSGDQGIDVIAEKGSMKIGIQAKCYSSTVGNSAIQEAVAGRAFYGCTRVMVITNSTFTKAAEELASANNVVLWGRDMLKEKLLTYPISM